MTCQFKLVCHFFYVHLSSRKKDEPERNFGVRFHWHAHKFFLLLNEDPKEEVLEQAKLLELQHKIKLEEKVKESDKLIEKNVDIKQSIINATQRTITFQ